MSFNVGNLIFEIMQNLIGFTSKLYDVVNYQVNIEWISKILSFFGANIDLPNSISLIGIIGSVSAVALVVIIIYNIFKL